MQLISNNITKKELKQMAERMFGNLVKAVVDIKKGLLVVDAELHADEEAFLLEQGSEQNDLWGINLYPDNTGDTLIEFDSMINIKPSQGNRSRGVDDAAIKATIMALI